MFDLLRPLLFIQYIDIQIYSISDHCVVFVSLEAYQPVTYCFYFSHNSQSNLGMSFCCLFQGRRVMAKKIVYFLLLMANQMCSNILTIPNAEALKNSGVEIFVIVVGSYINGNDEMVKVASYPPEHFIFRVKSLEEFWEVIKLVIKEVSPGKYKIVQGEPDPPC